MYAITGATGNTGGEIVKRLLAAGQKVRAIGRSEDKLKPLAEAGAETRTLDLGDTAALTKAFEGATAVYTMIPPNMTAPDYPTYQEQVGTSIAEAVKAAGVKYVVNLSSLGAHLPEGVGVVTGLHYQEKRLNALDGVNVVHLRPTFFMENQFSQMTPIRQFGVITSAGDPDAPIPQIATADIAAFAVERLTKLDFEGNSTQELLGPREYSTSEVAEILGKAIGRDNLRVQQISLEQMRSFVVGAGVSESVADGLVELTDAFNSGKARPTEERSAANTTPTTFEEFAKTFAAVYKS